MKNIVLIGMSGSGKTAVGKYISLKLSMDFVDTDDIIVLNTGYTIEHIFNKYGEKHFRYLEEKVIDKLKANNGKIISTGGGVVLNKSNMDIFKKNGVIFFLEASISTLVKNIKNSKLSTEHRPLLNFNNLYNSIDKIYSDRKELYLSNADFTIQVDNKSIEEIGEEIINYFR